MNARIVHVARLTRSGLAGVAIALVVLTALWLMRWSRDPSGPRPSTRPMFTPPGGDPMPVLYPSPTVDPRMPIIDSALPSRSPARKSAPIVPHP